MNERSWVRETILLSIGIGFFILITPAAEAQVPEPVAEVSVEAEPPPLPPGTGFIPPAFKLLHLPMEKAYGPKIFQPTTSWDWRWSGKVTSVKNQSTCGACYAFASLGNFESKILIDTSTTFDLSENNAKECPFMDPNCGGGTYYDTACLFSQKGTVLETCDPYSVLNQTCNTSCAYQQTLLDWHIISGGSVPSTSSLKNYIHSNGPVYTTLYVGSGPGDPWYDEFAAYNGTYGLYQPGSFTVNHAVLIVGWDDNQTYRSGGPGGPVMGSGCWLVKNSWGTGWGNAGYFYIDYSSAVIGQWSSYLDSWQNYDSSGGILYFDDAGWGTGTITWGYGSTTCWALCRYTPSSDTKAWAIEFWTNDVTTDVDVYLYDSFNTGTLALGTLITSSLNNSFSEAGYHSVSITPTNIGPSYYSGDAVAVVKITNSSYGYPIMGDDAPGAPLETNRCYLSPSGANGSWYNVGAHPTTPSDVGVRIRTSTAVSVNADEVY
jgi:C1A family cysteine protease